MFRKIVNHFKNNKGDANVSKATMIAIVFVVGAILLVLTTSAFRNPVNRWFDKVNNDWFSYDNGKFGMNTKSTLDLLGVKSGTKYAGYNDDGDYYELYIYDDKIVLTGVMNGRPEDGGTVEIPMSDCHVVDNQYFVINDPSTSGDWLQITNNGNTLVGYEPDDSWDCANLVLYKQP